MANKDQLLDRARELGVDVESLPQDGQGGPKNETLEQAIAAVSGEQPCTHDLFVIQDGSPSLNVPVAGLLRADPELRDAELTPSEWRKRLDAYLGEHVTEPQDEPEQSPVDVEPSPTNDA